MGYSILIRPPGADWGVVGRDWAPGITPEGLRCTADQSGPQDCSFTLKRDSRVPWPDLTPFTDLEVHEDTSGLVWGGRVWSVTPGARDTIGVTARGWQYLLDDDPTTKMWVRSGTQGFEDVRRTHAGAINYAVFNPASDYVANTGGNIHLGLPARAVSVNTVTGVILDLGPGHTAETVAVDYVNLSTTHAAISFAIQGYDDAACTTGGVNGYGPTASHLMTAPAATITGTFSSAKRFILLTAIVNTATTLTSTWNIRVTGVRVFRESSYESSGVSTLVASGVASEIRSDLSSVLSSDTSRIETTAFTIPELHTNGGYETPRQVLQRANAYHDYLTGVDAHRRLFFRARPTTPLIQIGDDTGASYADAGDTGEDLYNQVIVTGVQPDGALVNETRTATSPILDLGGYTRTKILTTQATLTTAAAQAIGDAWLARRKDRPTRGTVTVNGPGAATMVANGAPVQPAELLQHTGELMRVADRWSPDDGANARDGVVTNVSWDAATDSATVSLDSPRHEFEVLLTRYAALRAARPAG